MLPLCALGLCSVATDHTLGPCRHLQEWRIHPKGNKSTAMSAHLLNNLLQAGPVVVDSTTFSKQGVVDSKASQQRTALHVEGVTRGDQGCY